MANTLIYRKIQPVGTYTGGPPIMETFVSAAAIDAGDPVTLASGKVQRAVIVGAAGTDDTWADADVVAATRQAVGIALNATTAADQVVKVACFGPGQLFEGTHVGDDIEGDAGVNEIALAQTLIGTPVTLVKLSTAIDRTPVLNGVAQSVYRVKAGTWGVTTGSAAAFIGSVVRINYGVAGEGLGNGHGVIGDKATRVIFTFPSTKTLFVA